MSTLQSRLARGDVIILDGATATQLERKGLSNASSAWSALANLEHPDVVREVHEDYIEVGADVGLYPSGSHRGAVGATYVPSGRSLSRRDEVLASVGPVRHWLTSPCTQGITGWS